MKTRGRPTKYTPTMCKKVDEFLELMKDEETNDVVQVSSKGSESYKRRVIVRLPTIEKFARFVGVHKDTLYEWSSKYKNFSDSLDKIVEEQKNRLIESGLSGEYNPTIAKLVLSANHGMAEKSESEVTVKGLLSAEDRKKIQNLIE